MDARGRSAAAARSGALGPTWIERTFARLGVRYALGSVVLSVALGPAGIWALQLADGRSPRDAVAAAFRGMLPVEPWQQAAALVIWTGANLYSFFLIHEVPRRVAEAQAAIRPLLAAPDRAFRAAFGGIVRTGPAVIVTAAFLAIFWQEVVARWRFSHSVVGLAVNMAAAPLIYSVYGTAIWTYARALLGLHQLGRSPLKLAPYTRDDMFGLRPFGALSTQLTTIYFGFVGILLLAAVVGPVYVEFALSLVGVILLGVALFVLPVYGAHRQMAAARAAAHAALRERLAALVERPDPSPAADPPPAAHAEADVRALLAIEASERLAAGAKVWPFDTSMVRRVATIVTGLLLAVVTHFVIVWVDPPRPPGH